MVPHVNAVCQSSFFHLRKISFIRKYLTYDAAKIIFHAFLVSKLDYCNSLFYGLPSYLMRKFQHVQNSAARLINQCPRFCHITPVLRDLHWLPASSRIEFKIMLINYKVLHDRAPIYIQELLQLYTPSRNLRSSNRNLLVKPYFNLNSYGNELFLLLLWNFGITYLRILNLQTQLMILNANLKHFFLCELMNRDVLFYFIFY